jgi:hypothetical protein
MSQVISSTKFFFYFFSVHNHSSENMMPSSNLSIVWGACIFATKVNRMNSVENNDIKRINNFVCNLIDNYEEIFSNENINQMSLSPSHET